MNRRTLLSARAASVWITLFVVAIAITPAMAQDGKDDKAAGDEKAAPVTAANAQVLDLSEYQDPPSPSFERFFTDFTGKQVVDGIPFAIDGRTTLFGKSTASRGDDNIEIMRNVKVGRTIEDLHLIHHTFWPDVDGEVIAHVWLNYADGSSYIIPIRFGHHIRDWFNVPSFEKETVTDANTTICWRRDPVQFKAPVRLYKTRLTNPLPDKVVETIHFSSAGNLSSYSLLAATVSDAVEIDGDEIRDTGTDRKFDAKVNVSVVNDVTGKPIEKALVQIFMLVEEESVVGTPIYSSADGKGTIPYPTEHTARISASVTKDGYRAKSQTWQVPIPADAEFRLTPVRE